jgi:hypothetical protein
VNATFHERQYELAMNLELIASSGMFFAPLQLIEHHVGYDIALVPGHVAVWKQLGIGPRPRGFATSIAYDPKIRPAPGGPTFLASLFIQYKVAERMFRRNAREAKARSSGGGGVPFFRVRLNPDQHDVLMELENRVGSDAVVRYAAPLFHEIEDLWVHQSVRGVFAHSTFVAPSKAGKPPSCWTYDESGAPIFCSESRPDEADLGEDVLRALVHVAEGRPESQLSDHLRVLAAEVNQIDLAPRRRRRRLDDREVRRVHPSRTEAEWVRPPLTRLEWIEQVYELDPELTETELRTVVDAAVVANAAASTGLTWLLAEIQLRDLGR